jgi:hypothetical protein
MGGSNRSWINFLVMTFILAGLAGCNFPGRATEAPPAAEYTRAAQTVVAELTEVVTQPTTLSTALPTSPVPSPMPSPTVTLVPTATVAPTPTEKLTLLFSDDFSQQDNWYTEQGQEFGFQFAEGGYEIYVNIPFANIWSIRDKSYTDVVLEVDGARLAGPEDGYYGLLCRQVDGKNYYTLVIGSNGFYGIGKMKDGEFDFLQEDQDTENRIMQGADTFNRIRADCIGNNLRLYANGKMLIELQDDNFTSGVTGVLAGTNKETGLEALFDNYATYQP